MSHSSKHPRYTTPPPRSPRSESISPKTLIPEKRHTTNVVLKHDTSAKTGKESGSDKDQELELEMLMRELTAMSRMSNNSGDLGTMKTKNASQDSLTREVALGGWGAVSTESKGKGTGLKPYNPADYFDDDGNAPKSTDNVQPSDDWEEPAGHSGSEVTVVFRPVVWGPKSPAPVRDFGSPPDPGNDNTQRRARSYVLFPRRARVTESAIAGPSSQSTDPQGEQKPARPIKFGRWMRR